jgi:hypothetical protein
MPCKPKKGRNKKRPDENPSTETLTYNYNFNKTSGIAVGNGSKPFLPLFAPVSSRQITAIDKQNN